MPLRYANLNKIKSLSKEDPQKNMTDMMMTFEISEVTRDLVELGDKHNFTCYPSLLSNVRYTLDTLSRNLVDV